LIVERGFTAVALEADWPDAYRVNRYVRGEGADNDAEESLRDFRRFPSWMWRNADFLNFVGWLRDYNKTVPDQQRAGVYGLDLYSLFSSIQAVVRYLDRVDAPAAARARARYACFDHFNEDSQIYGYAAAPGWRTAASRKSWRSWSSSESGLRCMPTRDGHVAEDDSSLPSRTPACDERRGVLPVDVSRPELVVELRDQHMVDTLDALVQHLGHRRPNPKIVVWAHNSHLGNAGATEMGRRGELNVGQAGEEPLRRGGAAHRFSPPTTAR
jgi:erythromycin esterase-like protein